MGVENRKMDIPLCKIQIDEQIKQAVLNVLTSGLLVKGPQSVAFEQEFSRFIGTDYAIAVNSGTAALFITFMYLGLHKDDEIIVPSHTFIASISQGIHFGGKPVFVDINPLTYTMDIDEVRKKITPKTKVIVAVHIYGHPVDMDPLMELAQQHNIIVIEDCAQAHGSKYKGRFVGSIGDFSCFSFFPSKIINTGGDGGIVLTNDVLAAKSMKMLKNQGREKKYIHEMLGVNMRMSEIPAAIGRIQLANISKIIARRKLIVQTYNSVFSSLKDLIIPYCESWADPVYYVYTVQVVNREKFAQYLEQRGIHTGIYYPIPVHKQPIIENKYGKVSLPITEKLCQNIISLPLSAAMTDEEVQYVIKNVSNYFEQKL